MGKGEKSILVIEDETPLQQAIKIKLEAAGFDVVTARSVEQSLEYLNEISGIRAIWLDHYLLGKENGLDLVEHLKNNDQWKKIPIFVVSNTASNEKKNTYLELGVEKFYVKSDNSLESIIKDITKHLSI